jgi:hypothetical protein
MVAPGLRDWVVMLNHPTGPLQEQPVLSANIVFYGSVARAAEQAAGVSFFMNRFRELGFIDYNREVHSSLLKCRPPRPAPHRILRYSSTKTAMRKPGICWNPNVEKPVNLLNQNPRKLPLRHGEVARTSAAGSSCQGPRAGDGISGRRSR